MKIANEKIARELQKTAENILRANCLYFAKGKWPEVVKTELPGLFENGKEYVVAIIPAEIE